MSEKETTGMAVGRYTVNADGLEATLYPSLVVARFSDTRQGFDAAFKRIDKLVKEYNGEKFGAVLARYAPVGKVYFAYGVVRFRYESNIQRGWLNEADEYAVNPDIPFDTQESWCVVQFVFIDKSVTLEESHVNGGHNGAHVKGCGLCEEGR